MHGTSSTWVALAAFAGRSLASCAYGTHLSPRAEGEIKVGNFGYNGALGPSNWLAINATANVACATGTRQSPIDMVAGAFPKVAGSAINLKLNDFPEGTEFENLGTTVEVVAEKGGSMTIPGVGDFELQQFHFHLPSEHLDNGTSQAMEMHMVWQGANASVAVLSAYIGLVDQTGASAGQTRAAGVAGAAKNRKARAKRWTKEGGRASARRRQEGEVEVEVEAAGAEVEAEATTGAAAANTSASATGATTLLETVLNEVGKISTPGTATKTPALVMSELVTLLTAGEFQSYTGSLTTPPCTEGVNWLVSTQKLTIQPTTFVKARDVIGFNARFPQNTLGQTNLLQLSAKTTTAGTTTNVGTGTTTGSTNRTTGRTGSTTSAQISDALARLLELARGATAGSAASGTTGNVVVVGN